MTACGNLFAGLSEAETGEAFETLLSAPGTRIERILSRTQASPPGFRYDQEQDERVAGFAGTATLRFSDAPELRRPGPGDHRRIPARRRPLLERTDDPARGSRRERLTRRP